MRAVLELGGVRNVTGKSLGSRNPINTIQATLEALRKLKSPQASSEVSQETTSED